MNATPPITTSFNLHSTATQVVAVIDLSGKQIIVTGGASGIGVETARALARPRRCAISTPELGILSVKP